jgi:hypothetical protein
MKNKSIYFFILFFLLIWNITLAVDKCTSLKDTSDDKDADKVDPVTKLPLAYA